MIAQKEQIAEEARRFEKQKAKQAAEKEARFLAQMVKALAYFGGNKRKAQTFVRVQQIISEELNIEDDKINFYSKFSDDLGADSLDAVTLIMALEEEFDIEIPDEDAEGISTVEAAVN